MLGAGDRVLAAGVKRGPARRGWRFESPD